MSIIKGIESRLYQEMLFMEAKDQNSLVVLPTGLGKTIIILYLTGHFYQKFPDKKILIATPTKPLVNQIGETLRNYLNIDHDIIIEVAGSVTPAKRKILYKTGKIFIGTPQTFSNDFDTDKLKPKDFSLLCFDEAHRSTGNYAYVKIVHNFFDFNLNPRIIGFTATPGNRAEQIEAVISNLHIESICSRFPDDSDVKPYISSHKPKIVWVDLPTSYKEVSKFFDEYEKEILTEVKSKGLEVPKYLNKRVALDLQKQVSTLMHDDPEIAELLYYVPNLTRILHIKEIMETQGLPQARSTLEKWFHEPKKKTLRMFVEHPYIKTSYELIQKFPEKHPKLQKLIEILTIRTKENPESKIIIFSNFRDTVDYLVDELQKEQLIAKKFVGQSSQKGSAGMSQKDQISILDEFKTGELNILVSTSVGEEGIDVGACDLVIFYDSVSSVVRTVQRIGRGRKKQSEVVRLITKNTKDSAMYYAMLRQEKNIQNFIRTELPKKLNQKIKYSLPVKTDIRSLPITQVNTEHDQENQTSLQKFFDKNQINSTKLLSTKDSINKKKIKEESIRPQPEKVPSFVKSDDKFLILVDNREGRSQVPRLLKKDKDIKLQLINLAEGDYKISEECVIERKTMHDLAESIIDGRLFDQVGNKLSTYKKPIIILEGVETDIQVNLNPKAIKGAIASILLSYKIPILRTLSETETADIIIAMAKREQKNQKYSPSIQTISKKYPIKEIQRFILSSIPGVNRAKADQILNEFKTIKQLANAEYDEIIELEGIGKILTERILKILQTEASDSDHV